MKLSNTIKDDIHKNVYQIIIEIFNNIHGRWNTNQIKSLSIHNIHIEIQRSINFKKKY